MFERNRTRPFIIRYALYLYFLGLSLRNTSKALEPFVDRSYVAIWYWIQEYNETREHGGINGLTPSEMFLQRLIISTICTRTK